MPDMKKLRSWVKNRLAELDGPVINQSIGEDKPAPGMAQGPAELDPPKVAKAVPSPWVKQQDAIRRKKPAGRTDVVAAARIY